MQQQKQEQQEQEQLTETEAEAEAEPEAEAGRQSRTASKRRTERARGCTARTPRAPTCRTRTAPNSRTQGPGAEWSQSLPQKKPARAACALLACLLYAAPQSRPGTRRSSCRAFLSSSRQSAARARSIRRKWGAAHPSARSFRTCRTRLAGRAEVRAREKAQRTRAPPSAARLAPQTVSREEGLRGQCADGQAGRVEIGVRAQPAETRVS